MMPVNNYMAQSPQPVTANDSIKPKIRNYHPIHD